MHSRIQSNRRLARPSDLFLPAALIAATLLGRPDAALDLFLALTLTRLCALSTASGLRSAFAVQPSIRYVQGSLLIALLAQLAGCAVALPIWRALRPSAAALPLMACGLALNIEHTFYEYLYAINERESAVLCHGLTALMTATGLLLGPSSGSEVPWLPVTTGLSALTGLTVCALPRGAARPRPNAEVLKRAPVSMLRTAIYPVLFAAIARLSGIYIASPLPLFVGLGLYELCGSPFRRSPLESAPMNRALGVVCAVAACIILASLFGWLPNGILTQICGALLLAAACAFAMYGRFSVTFPRRNPQRSYR